jgi:hypothetical protein
MAVTNLVSGKVQFARYVDAAAPVGGQPILEHLQPNDVNVVVNIAAGQKLKLGLSFSGEDRSEIMRKIGNTLPAVSRIGVTINGYADTGAFTIVSTNGNTINGVTDPYVVTKSTVIIQEIGSDWIIQ